MDDPTEIIAEALEAAAKTLRAQQVSDPGTYYDELPDPQPEDREIARLEEAIDSQLSLKSSRKKKIEEENHYPNWIEESARSFEGKVWMRGTGQIPSSVLIVGERPGTRDRTIEQVFKGPVGKFLNNRLTQAGFDCARAYFTCAIKYSLGKDESVSAKDIKACRGFLLEEIRRIQPRVVVCLGSQALTTVMGKGVGISAIRGEFVQHPDIENVMVYCMHNPAAVIRNPEMMPAFDRDINNLVAFQKTGVVKTRPTITPEIIQTAQGVEDMVIRILQDYPQPLIFVDLEWEGKHWMDPTRYLRTAQLGYADGKAVVVEFRFENGVPCMDDEPRALGALKALLEDSRVMIGGHNVIADGEWLLSYGIDIRPRVVWDTMLAEFLLHETGPWGLEELTLSYTEFGRYDLAVGTWVKEHRDECRHGYGAVPRELLIPYGALDVEAPRQAMMKQAPLIARDFMAPRGVNGEYPSLWDTTMTTQRLIYELERTGLLVDRVRLDPMIRAYQEVRSQLLGLITTETAAIGFPEFNAGSPADVSKLLFQHLKLSPVKTTKGRSWAGQVGNQGMDDSTEYAPSTDRETLEILEDAHPVVKHLLQFRRIDTACKTWLRWPKEGEDEASAGGGLIAKIWPDGRIHAHFSQLAETGRFRHSKPNVANWPKKAEGYMVEIFGGKDKVPANLRTIIVPPPGHVIMEADFIQAELFVLAGLSGDQNMMGALTTPGKDLHDVTAISSFKLRVIDPEGKDVPEEFLIDLARRDKKAFETFQKTLRYVDLKGGIMTRSEFKDTMRVSGKSVNFGVPYGRGALAIAQLIKAETGTAKTINELEQEIKIVLETWKTVAYPQAWEFMQKCAASVYDPGYLVNPWGRIRRFPKVPTDNEERADLERQAQNHPIQSTVADTVQIAMDLMDRYRTRTGLKFSFINQVHDAVQIYIPEDKIDEGKKMYRETMGNIVIPVGGPFGTLTLGVDIDVMDRWGSKIKA